MPAGDSEKVIGYSEEDIDELHRFDTLNEWTARPASAGITGKLIARIVKYKGKLFLDVREWQKKPEWEGFTKRGVRLSINEVRVLESYILPKAREFLHKR